LQGANRLESPQHSNHAVKPARIGYGINVGTGANRFAGRIGAFPSRKGIAHGIDPDFQTGVLKQPAQKFAGRHVLKGKN